MILQYLFLNDTPKFFMFPNLPKFQAMHQLGHDILRRDIPVVPLHYTARAEMWPKRHINCRSYKWQLHVSATQQQSSDCLYEKTKFYTCSLYIYI